MLGHASADPTPAGHGHSITNTFLWIVIILLAAKFSGLVERFGQPPVLGELVMGVVLGNLSLVGLQFFEPIKTDTIIKFCAELGVVILLFQIGLESSIQKLLRVGLRATLVACIGVILPFLAGTYFVGPIFFPSLPFNAHLFLGATLTATSVGITARVFQDLKRLQTPEAQIVLGAAVIDDILGLIILAVVSAIATTGKVGIGSVSWITAKASIFLVGAIVLGQVLAPKISKFFSKIHTGAGMKFTLAISFCLLFAYCAAQIGLAPIVGAFAAGLVLDPVHFRFFEVPEIVDEINHSIQESEPNLKEQISKIITSHSDRHIEDFIKPLGYFFVPIFFVLTGMAVKLDVLFNPTTLMISIAISVTAILTKVLAGLAAGNVNKAIVGWGMVPRGEVGLIFAAIGKSIGVVSDEAYSVIVVMVVLTTLCTPPILTYLIKKQNKKQIIEHNNSL